MASEWDQTGMRKNQFHSSTHPKRCHSDQSVVIPKARKARARNKAGVPNTRGFWFCACWGGRGALFAQRSKRMGNVRASRAEESAPPDPGFSPNCWQYRSQENGWINPCAVTPRRSTRPIAGIMVSETTTVSSRSFLKYTNLEHALANDVLLKAAWNGIE
jgi:hypothetical protein